MLSAENYEISPKSTLDICNDIVAQLKLWKVERDMAKNKQSKKYSDEPSKLPTFFLTLKAHKDPQGARGVTSVTGTPIAGVARVLSAAQELCIATLHDIWQRIALLCNVKCNGCWIIADIAAVPKRMLHAYRYKENWLRPLSVWDFTSMYDKFVHHDMKLKLREITNMIFSYMNGNRILPELNQYTDRQGFTRRSGNKYTSIAVYYKNNSTRGISSMDKEKTEWTDFDIHKPINNGVRLDADLMSDMVDFMLDNSFVSHGGVNYRQTVGMAMGVHNAPQLANLYCGYYELQYMLRRTTHYLNTLKQFTLNPTVPRDPYLRAEMTALFNSCRLMDDIAMAGMPANTDCASILRDERLTDGTDGIYPVLIADADGNLRNNPMLVNLEKQGLICSYLDMKIEFKDAGKILFEVYNKRDDMPVFANYRRFPHADSILAKATKYNTFRSQIDRFASRCNTMDRFIYHTKKLLHEMIEHGYSRSELLNILYLFSEKFVDRQRNVFDQTVRVNKKTWRKVMEELKKKD